MSGKQKASKDIQILFRKRKSDFTVFQDTFFHLKQDCVPHHIIILIFLKLSIVWEIKHFWGPTQLLPAKTQHACHTQVLGFFFW